MVDDGCCGSRVASAADRGGIPWDTAPSYLIRDKYAAHGQAFTNRIRTMGIRDCPIAPRPYVERLIETLRRECLDRVLTFGERHLHRVLTLYSLYYNETRTHLGLAKDAPIRDRSSGRPAWRKSLPDEPPRRQSAVSQLRQWQCPAVWRCRRS